MNLSWSRWGKVLVMLVILLQQINGWASVPAETTSEAAKKILRVGYFEDNKGFQNGFSDEERKSGYAYEYYQNIARLNGWEYQYVYGAWSDIYLKLLQGEVDIVAGISKCEERAGKILYPEYPMGTESYHIFVPVDYKGIQDRNISSLNGKRIGVNAHSLMLTLFEKFVQDNSLACEIKTYPSHSACSRALKGGEIDGYIITDNYVVAGVKPVMKIGKSDIYFGVNKYRQDVLEELNQAQEQILASLPYYNTYLQTKYFDRSVLRLALNDEELSWLKTTEQITIGFIDNKLPYCDISSDSDECRGIIVTLQQELNKFLGIPVKLKAFPDAASMLEALYRREIQVIFPAYGDIWNAERKQLRISNTILKVRAIAIYQGQYDPTILKRVGVTKNNSIMVPYLRQYYPDSRIIFYDNIESCLTALRAGQINSVIDDCNLVTRYLDNTAQEQNFRLAYL
ncbi:MAG: transporter substrate-binding domain-containing protein, partial [Victivallaceae bacterium]